jgi:hypothetical protein
MTSEVFSIEGRRSETAATEELDAGDGVAAADGGEHFPEGVEMLSTALAVGAAFSSVTCWESMEI